MGKWLYYLLQWTWGIVTNIIGGLIYIVLLCIDGIYTLIKHRHYIWFGHYRNAALVVTPWSTGAISLGMFIICGKYSESCKEHEYGHSIQNIQWGPLFLIVIGIPSFIRYWYREFYYKFIYEKTRKLLPDYYSIWFEKQASEYGKIAADGTWLWL